MVPAMTTEQSWGQPAPFAHRRTGPSTAWFWIAGLLAIAGIAAAAWFGFRGASRFTDSLAGMDRVPVPGQATVDLDAAGGYYVSFEDGPVPNHLVVDVVGPDGQPVAVDRYVGDLTYTINGREGTAVFTFDAPAPGAYQVQARSEDGRGTIAIGTGIAGGVFGLVGGIFTAIGIAGLSLILAIVIVVVVAVLRSRARTPQAPAWAPPPAGPPAGQSPFT